MKGKCQTMPLLLNTTSFSDKVGHYAKAYKETVIENEKCDERSTVYKVYLGYIKCFSSCEHHIFLGLFIDLLSRIWLQARENTYYYALHSSESVMFISSYLKGMTDKVKTRLEMIK